VFGYVLRFGGLPAFVRVLTSKAGAGSRASSVKTWGSRVPLYLPSARPPPRVLGALSGAPPMRGDSGLQKRGRRRFSARLDSACPRTNAGRPSGMRGLSFGYYTPVAGGPWRGAFTQRTGAMRAHAAPRSRPASATSTASGGGLPSRYSSAQSATENQLGVSLWRWGLRRKNSRRA
jgi:hypothetical protein